MNIFYLDKNPQVCAQMHNNKHCVKMILEYAQLLSTTHRILDGTQSVCIGRTGRKQKKYVLSDNREHIIYSATHINHPSAIWVRQSVHNYRWLFNLWLELMKEYTYRYGKNHKCEFLIDYLMSPPNNIPLGEFTEPTPAMPDNVKVSGDSIQSYRNYYSMNKVHLANWSGKINGRDVPVWFSNFEREIS